MTFVPPTVSRWPRDSIKEFLHMGYLAARNKFVNYLYMVIHKVYSKPGWRSRPLFKMRKAAIIPAARDLHARMNSAIATGNKEELKRVCTQELYEKLSGIVDSRPKGQSVKWELEGGQAKCSVRDDRIAMMPLTPTENRTIRQAVVAVVSTQRIVTIDEKRGGAEVPGTAKAKPVRENIVLTSYVDEKTWQQGPWRIWGTLPDSTIKGHTDEVAAYTAMSEEQAKS
jgi:protein MBA1